MAELKKGKKRKIWPIIIIVLALGLAAYLIVNNFFLNLDKSGSKNPMPQLLIKAKLETTFVADFINQEPYNKLEAAAPLPVIVGSIGHSNPFRAGAETALPSPNP